MPAYSGNRRNQNSNDNKRRWNAGGPMRDGGRRNEGRSLQDRMSSHGSMISPWESGVAPGAQSYSLLGDFQSLQNQFAINTAVTRNALTGSSYDMPNKIQRLDAIGNFGDQRGRGLLPSPNASLMGVAPQNFSTSRNSNLQQRLGNNWSSGDSAPRRTGSGYYPSDSRRDNSRRQIRQPYRSSHSSKDNNRDRSRNSDKRPKETDWKDNSSSKDQDTKSPLKDESSEMPKEENKETEEDKDKTSTSTKENDKAVEKLENQFPVEALKCHICDLDTFTSKKGYIRHLEGISHTRMAEKFHEKNATLLEFLNVSAKFAEMRRKDKLVRSSSSRNLPQGKIIEKIILNNYLRLESCCGKKFRSPFELHEHKLSVHHLKNMYEKSLNDKKDDEEEDITPVVDENIDEKIKVAKEEIEKEPLTVTNIPVYDPKNIIGLNYIEKSMQYKCDLCRRSGLFTSVEDHCLSFKHYDNIVSVLNKEEERRLIEEHKEAKEKEEESNENEKSTQKYERRNDEDCESNFSDKNEEQKFLSYEDYIQDDDEMIILDEKNDDTLSDEPQTILDEDKTDDTQNEEPQDIDEDKAEDTLMSEEPQTILDEMADDEIQVVGEDFEDPMAVEAVEEHEVQVMEEECIEVEQPKKSITPRRSSRVRQ